MGSRELAATARPPSTRHGRAMMIRAMQPPLQPQDQPPPQPQDQPPLQPEDPTPPTMQALAVYPGKPNSMHSRRVPVPRVTDIPDGRGVLVSVLRVGVDGTDREIIEAQYGAAPPGDDFLITGHENFGQVIEVGPHVPPSIRPGTFVVSTVRRPGTSIYDRIGLQDFTTDDVAHERGINLLHGYLSEWYVE